MNVKINIIEQKNRITKIINSFEQYYKNNYLDWDIKELTLSHQILGTLIMTFKKADYMEKSLDYFEKNEMMELFNIELEEVIIITNFYYETFVIKKGV